MAQRPDSNNSSSLPNNIFNPNSQNNNVTSTNQIAQMLQQYAAVTSNPNTTTINSNNNNQQAQKLILAQQQQARIAATLSQMMRTGNLPNNNNVLNNVPLVSQMQLLQSLQQQQGQYGQSQQQNGALVAPTGQWKQSLSAADRQNVIDSLINTVRMGMPEKQRNEKRINDLARQVEQQIYEKATSKEDYLLKTQAKIASIYQKLSTQGQPANAAASEQTQSNPVSASNPGVLGAQRPVSHPSQQAQQLLQQQRNAQAAAAQAIRPQLTSQQQQQARLLSAAQGALRVQNLIATGQAVDPRQQAAIESFVASTGMQPQQYLQLHNTQLAQLLQQQQQAVAAAQQHQTALAAVSNPALSLAASPPPLSNLTSPSTNANAIPTSRSITNNNIGRPQGAPRLNAPATPNALYRPGPNVPAVNVGTVNAATSSAAAVAAVVSQVQAQNQQGSVSGTNNNITLQNLKNSGSNMRLRQWQLSHAEAQQVVAVMHELRPVYERMDEYIKMIPLNSDSGREKMNKINQMRLMMREQYDGLQRPVQVFYLNSFMANQLKKNMSKLLQYVEQYNLKGLPSPAPTPLVQTARTNTNVSTPSITNTASPPRISGPAIGAMPNNSQLVAAQAEILAQQAQSLQSRASPLIRPGLPNTAVGTANRGSLPGAPSTTTMRPGFRPNMPNNTATRASPSRPIGDGNQAAAPLNMNTPPLAAAGSGPQQPFLRQAQQVEKVSQNLAASNTFATAAGGATQPHIATKPPFLPSQLPATADSPLMPTGALPNALGDLGSQSTGISKNNREYEDANHYLKDMADDLSKLVTESVSFNAFLAAEFSGLIERRDGFGSWPEDLDQLVNNSYSLYSNSSAEDINIDHGIPWTTGKGWGMGLIVEDDDDDSFVIESNSSMNDGIKEVDDLTALGSLDCLSPPPSPKQYCDDEDDGPMRKRLRQLEAM